jgi:hypothetical protein
LPGFVPCLAILWVGGQTSAADSIEIPQVQQLLQGSSTRPAAVELPQCVAIFHRVGLRCPASAARNRNRQASDRAQGVLLGVVAGFMLKYDPGEHRFKHKNWRGEHFNAEAGRPVGQCPPEFHQVSELAGRLLNDGIPWNNPGDKRATPHYVYNVYKGVVYEATRTEPGKSYHGYPFRGRLPRVVLTRLEAIAEAQGCLHQMRRWLRVK